VAPVYRPYTLALQLRSGGAQVEIPVPVDVRTWLPGNALFEGELKIPATLKPGKYDLRVALLDPGTNLPAIRLAIEGRQDDGWYLLDKIEVK
jgi:hypothetical protein